MMPQASRDAEKGQLGSLDGTWLVVEGQLGGVRLPSNAFDELTVTLQRGQFELGGDWGRIAVDRQAAPAALDVLIVGGPNRGRYVPAIVERVGPLLRICYDLAGSRRPATFLAPPGTRFFLATYRRAVEGAQGLAPAPPESAPCQTVLQACLEPDRPCKPSPSRSVGA